MRSATLHPFSAQKLVLGSPTAQQCSRLGAHMKNLTSQMEWAPILRPMSFWEQMD